MPIFGIGIHIIIAIFFAIHAVRNNRNLYWLIVLFSFPLFGSIVYFVVEYLPNSRLNSHVNRGVGKAAATAVSLLDPEREVREARAAFDLSPSAQNRMRLAKALLARGETHESIAHFDACLSGPFGNDPEFLYAAATAKLQDGQAQAALELAQKLRKNVPEQFGERASLLLAEAYSATGDKVTANAEFASTLERFGSFEARARYAIWSAEFNNLNRAEKLYEDIVKSQRHWNSHTRNLNRPLLQQVEKAIALGKRSTG